MVGEEARGKALIEEMDGRIARARDRAGPLPESLPTALIYHVNGLVSAEESLGDNILTAAALANAARRLPGIIGSGGRVPLEVLVSAPPQLIVLAQSPDTYESPVADNLRHPALRHTLRHVPSVHLPERLLLCGTQFVAEAVERLAEARRRLKR